MGMVNVLFKWADSAFDLEYAKHEMVYRIDKKNIIYIEDGFLEIEEITEETEKAIIVDIDITENISKPISIAFQNIDESNIDFTNEAVINFAKYLIKLKEGS